MAGRRRHCGPAPADAEAPLVLDGSGAALWELLAEPLPVDDIAALAQRYDVTLDDLRRDVERALDEMSSHGLLEDPLTVAIRRHRCLGRRARPGWSGRRSAPRPVATRLGRAGPGCGRRRTTGLLLEAVAGTGRPPPTACRTAPPQTQRLGQSLVLERTLLEVSGELTPGIPHRVLKGAAVAMLDYPDPTLRAFGDIDLLVRADDCQRLEWC